ncbi:MAG: NBR1-Ig-like domain-containing protein [Anaerolineaceae bacterium]
MKPIKLAGLNALLALVLLGAACTPAAAPTPTLDPNVLYTAAAQTVIAQLTQNAPPPTATPAPTQTTAVTATRLAGLPTIPPLGTLSPLKTATLQMSAGGDKCEYYSQSPADNSTVKTGQVFNVIWKIKNVGTTNWGAGYVWRFYSASNKLSTSQNSYDMTATTAPNAIADITVVASAPSSAGTVDTTWVLTNPQGVNFCSFNVKVNVVAAAAAASEATAVPATEAHYITYDHDGGPTVPGTINFNGNMIQVRAVFNTHSGYTDSVTIQVNGGPITPASRTSSSSTVAESYVLGSFTHSDTNTYSIVTTGEVKRVEVCDSSVNCW